jgi:hypothetical protein
MLLSSDMHILSAHGNLMLDEFERQKMVQFRCLNYQAAHICSERWYELNCSNSAQQLRIHNSKLQSD